MDSKIYTKILGIKTKTIIGLRYMAGLKTKAQRQYCEWGKRKPQITGKPIWANVEVSITSLNLHFTPQEPQHQMLKRKKRSEKLRSVPWKSTIRLHLQGIRFLFFYTQFRLSSILARASIFTTSEINYPPAPSPLSVWSTWPFRVVQESRVKS